jgi:hypothetical protein
MAATPGTTFLGQVVSGSGATYMVQLNPTQGGPTVSATVPQIDNSQSVPAGTSCIVVQIGGTYYFQPAVWLTPA